MESKNKNINDIYTSLEDAKEEIWKRWNNLPLRRQVKEFLGKIPEVLNEPKACLWRYIMTPNAEYNHFVETASQVNLKPLGWEYLEDKFVTINKDKLGLGKISISRGKNKNGDKMFIQRKIIDIKKHDGKKFSEIKALWGESFVDFHHRILKSVFSEIELFDSSSWLMSKGQNSKDYYNCFLSLFVCHGILFENYLKDGYEKEFTDEIIYPAIEKIKKIFGIKPLIVQLLPQDGEGSKDWYRYWTSYPEFVEKEIERCSYANENDILEKVKNKSLERGKSIIEKGGNL